MANVLGLDLDGTLADHTQAKLQLAELFNVRIQPHQTSPEVLVHLMDGQSYRLLQQRLYNDNDGLARTSPPTEGSHEAIQRLLAHGWRPIVVSRRKDTGRNNAREWIIEHYRDLIKDENIFFVDEDPQKNIICEREGVGVYIDDQVNVLGRLRSVPQRILFDPYENWDNEKAPDITIMRSWSHLVPLLVGERMSV